jgi:hypothetical protein
MINDVCPVATLPIRPLSHSRSLEKLWVLEHTPCSGQVHNPIPDDVWGSVRYVQVAFNQEANLHTTTYWG